MSNEVLMVGCDLHDQNMLLRIAVGKQEPITAVYRNTVAGRKTAIARLKRDAYRAKAQIICLAYEASSVGYGFCDELLAAGIDCRVLAPHRLSRSSKDRRLKTDARDAQFILELIRGHVLAGNELPEVWLPDSMTRQVRQVVRLRLDLGVKRAQLKNQIQALLKQAHLKRPEGTRSWTVAFRTWLDGLQSGKLKGMNMGSRVTLRSYRHQLNFLDTEISDVDRHVKKISQTKTYRAAAEALQKLKGVGLLSAMVFLSELGDLERFSNRRQIGSFLGLVPSSFESGVKDDRKGHITRTGSSRVRMVLCQCVWTRLRNCSDERATWERITHDRKDRRKKATVAMMRRLAIKMWHTAVDAIRSASPRSVGFQLTPALVG